jgi:hypothetical protein
VTTRRHTEAVQAAPAPQEPAIGVCYVTAVADPGGDVSELLVRLVMTSDVASPETITRQARGPDAACLALRTWMSTMCQPEQLR